MNLIKKYGQRTAITVHEDTDIIYKGNTTWKAMKDLGYTHIAISPQEFLDEKESAGYSISDNKSNEWTEWDESKLASLIKEKFDGVEEAQDYTGFKEKEILGFSYDEELPMDLPDVDLEADGLSTKVDYMVVQFKNRNAMLEFKKLVDPDSKHPRVVPFAVLEQFMSVTRSLNKAGFQGSEAGLQTKKKFKLKLRGNK